MALLTFAVILALIFIFNYKNFVYALMVFFVMFDMFDGFYDDNKIFAAVRYMLPFALLLIFIFKESALKKNDWVYLTVVFYMIVLLGYNTGDIIVSTKNVIAIFLSITMIPVGRAIGKYSNFLGEFRNFNRFLLYILPVYIVIANLFKIGAFFYTDAFTTGYLVTSRIYIIPIVVFLAIHYVINDKTSGWMFKSADLIFIVINIGIMIINTRRTALLMLIGALLIYGFMNRGLIIKMVVMLFFFVVALVVTYPLYKEALTAQLEKRDRIQDIDTYEEEGRLLETLYIIHYHSTTQKFSELFFGVKLFDTYDFGTRYFGRDRPIHSDINMLFYSTGIFGLTLFGFLVIYYFLRGNRKILKENRQIYYPILAMFLMVFIPGRFIGTLTYAPLLVLILSAVKAQRMEALLFDDKSDIEAENSIMQSI